MKCNRFLVFAGVALLAVGAGDVKIPRPTDKLAPPPPAPAVEASAVSLPVSISVETLAGAIAKAFPAQRSEEKTWIAGADLVGRPGFEYQYLLWRGKPVLRASGDGLVVNFPEMKYRVRGRLEADGPVSECGYSVALRPLTLKATAKIAWASDGTVESHTVFEPVELSEPCKLQPMDVDMTPVLRKLVEARLPAAAKALDDAIRAQSLSRRRLAALWRQLQQPTELRPGLWLSLSPAGVSASPFSAEGDRAFKTSLSLDLAPRAGKGQKPAAGNAPLPDVHVGAAKGAGCHLTLPIRIPHVQMNQRLQKEVVGTEFDSGPLGKIKIVSAFVYGSGDKLIVEVGVTGGVNGTIYVIGKPVLDSTALVLVIEDLDLTIETKNLFAKAANAFAKDKLIAALEPSTHVELKDQIEALRSDLQSQFQREIIPGVRMEASDVRVTPRGVYRAPGSIEIQAVVDANLRLTVK